jgi:hypothetical protein
MDRHGVSYDMIGSVVNTMADNKLMLRRYSRSVRTHLFESVRGSFLSAIYGLVQRPVIEITLRTWKVISSRFI